MILFITTAVKTSNPNKRDVALVMNVKVLNNGKLTRSEAS
jgi:hypothetical protein